MICSQCKKCGECGKPYSANSNYAEKCKDFEKKKITNFERIKQMSIEEMADYIACRMCCSTCPIKPVCIHDHVIGCRNVFRKWLESEAEE